ncbi:MAG TPA: CCA tRNA nucleotidyltransferase [Micropepsaceae bacterium]|nr:CCA tRNA nucleotidyltransferase [Micropepsaceae bacterium]
MTAAPARAVMAALSASEDGARFVGGAVRNALLGEAVMDVDIAARFPPDEVTRRLEAAGLRAIATGIEHGTVTAVVDGTPYEVTSLRRDVEAFGRRAVVAYTTDWAEDAARRDFTINALYAGEDGTLFDYFGGLDDIPERRVRFIGDARQRIREDFLRILRFFRFHAQYGRGDADRGGLAACIAEKAGLKFLSGERVQKELLLLLKARDPVPAIRVMQETGILNEIIPGDVNLPRLERLTSIEQSSGAGSDAVLRLAALLPDSANTAREIAEKLRLSNDVRDRLVAAAEKDERTAAPVADSCLRELMYRMGKDRTRDQLLLRWADAAAQPVNPQWQAMLGLMREWQPPVFPVDGNDVMALGVPEGREIGVHLRDIEQWWIAQDFAPTRTELLERLRSAVLKT